MPKVKLKEMRGARVDYISLVDRAASRIPFRVMKRDKGESMIDLSKIFKSDVTPSVAAVIVRDSGNENVNAAVLAAVKKSGFNVEHVVKGDNTLVMAQSADQKGVQLVKLSEGLVVAVKGFQSYDAGETFPEMVAANGFYSGLNGALDVVYNQITGILADSEDPAESATKVDTALGDFSEYVVGLVKGLPAAAFKCDIAVRKALRTALKAESVPCVKCGVIGCDGDESTTCAGADIDPGGNQDKGMIPSDPLKGSDSTDTTNGGVKGFTAKTDSGAELCPKCSNPAHDGADCGVSAAKDPAKTSGAVKDIEADPLGTSQDGGYIDGTPLKGADTMGPASKADNPRCDHCNLFGHKTEDCTNDENCKKSDRCGKCRKADAKKMKLQSMEEEQAETASDEADSQKGKTDEEKKAMQSNWEKAQKMKAKKNEDAMAALISAVQSVASKVESMSVTVADVAKKQGEQQKVVDALVQKQEHIDVRLKSTVASAPAGREDRPATDGKKAVKQDDGLRTPPMFTDTAMLSNRGRNRY